MDQHGAAWVRLLGRVIIGPAERQGDMARRDYMTRVTLSMIVVSLGLLTLGLMVAAVAGAVDYSWAPMLLVMDPLVALGWWGVRRGGWRWGRFLPILVFLALGLYGSWFSGWGTSLILTFAIVIILASMLVGNRVQAGVTALCILLLLIGWWRNPLPLDQAVPAAVNTIACLIGIALLQWLSTGELRNALRRADRTAATLRDEVAERTRAEERLRDVVDAAPYGAHHYVLEEDGRLVFVGANRSANTILGVDHRQFLGLTIEEAFPPLTQTEVPEAYRRAAATGMPYVSEQVDYEGESIRGAFDVHALQTGPRRMTAFFRDITESKRAQEALRASEERYRTLVEKAPLGILVVDGQGVIQSCNAALVAILGSPSEEATRAMNLLTFPPLMEAGVAADFATCLRTGEAGLSEHPYISKWGKPAYLRYHLTPLRDGQGQVVAVQGLVEDITAYKQIEEQLRQAQKMEAVGRLAGGVAHDFNNLLTVINGYSQMLLDDAAEDHPQRDELQQILQAGQRAAALTQQLLAFSRRQMLELRVLNLNEVITGLSRMLTRIIGEDVQLVLRPAANLGQVKADPGQIEQVLVNLVVNARDAMPSGGVITIETANVVLGERHLARDRELHPGRYVMFAVSDTGVGMAPEVQEHLFEPFFTTKGVGRGTGLGLSTIYGIVKQSGGAVFVYSELGHGTTFKIYLPCLEEEEQPTAPVEAEATLPRGVETVLVVEDSAEVRQLVVRMLGGLGYRVLEAASPEEGLRLAAPGGEPIQLLLTDVVMPAMSGKQFAQQLGALRPEVKVLYMSGYTENTIVHHGVLDEHVSFIPKPFSVEQLARAVREALAQ